MNPFILILLLFFACTHPKPPPPSTLRLAFHSFPSTFDPRKSGDFLSSTLICLTHEGLTRPLPSGEVELALAERIEISPDRRIYTFHLRNAHWSDGHPIVAADFERSWKAIVSPSFPSLSPYLLFPIKNGEKCAKGEISSEELGVVALNEKTLQVELERPTPYFLSLTAFPLLLPVPSHLDTFSKDVCSGPFRIAKCAFNQEILLEKNPHFWNPHLASLNAIQILIIPNETTALQMFEREEIDWIGSPFSSIPLDSLSLLQNRLQNLPMAASTFIACNTKEFPFSNLNLRKALSLSLDRARIIKETAPNLGTAAARPLPPSLWNGPLPPLLEKSDEEGARLFLEKGLQELNISKDDLASIVLYYNSGQIEKKIAQALQREWEKTLGISFKIEQLNTATYLQKLHAHDFQLALSSWIAQLYDPSNLLERFRLASHSKNYAGWENTSYASLLEEAAITEDLFERNSLLMRAEEIFARELPIIPLYHWTNSSLIHPRLKEVVVTKSGSILFERFSL